MSGPLEKARAAWGAEFPDWVRRLAEECAKTSQNKVANRINRSASLVSAVLSRSYKGDMAAVEEVVRGVYFSATIDCPALGQIGTNACRDWMRLASSFSNINSERVRMYQPCRTCARFRKEAPDAV